MTSGGTPNHARERVLTEDLASVLQLWKDRYEAERPEATMAYKSKVNSKEFGKTGFSGRDFFGVMQYISFHSGVSSRRIYGILKRETKTTSYWMADQILTPLGLQNALTDGRIRSVDQPAGRPPKERPTPDPLPFMSKLKKPETWSNEMWLEYLDSIGCRR